MRISHSGILMILGSYYPEITGGVTQSRSLIKTLKEKFKFMVLVTMRNMALPRRERVEGADVFRIPLRNGSRIDYFNAIFRFISFSLQYRNNIRIVHMHGFTIKSILFILIFKILHKKIILTMSSVGYDDPVTIRKRSFLLYQFYSSIDVYVGISPQFEKLYQKAALPIERFIHIPNGIDVERFCDVDGQRKKILKEQFGFPLGLKIILFVGHFSKEKCPDILIKAWKKYVADLYSDSGVVFIGATDPGHPEVDSDLVDEVKKMAAPYLNERVFFIDSNHSFRHQIEKFYQVADIFVMPTLREGLPYVMLEAMSCELPVIVSKLEGVTDWVVENDVNGLLISPGNGCELSEALIRLLGDAELSNALGKKARKTIKKRFRVEEMASKYEKLYNNPSIN